MYSIDKSELPMVDEICSTWEKTTGFELETDEIFKVWLKDVNNLLFIDTKGKVKTVGGYLNYGISVKGAWAINNNATIVKKAVIEYFVKDIPVEETINNSTDIFEFQLIAKAGAKYKEAYHLVDGEKVPVQKVNRIYATTDKRYGKIYKVKSENDMTAKIESLPEHCIIDNDNKLTIDKVDKTFYIELAKKRINDYLGIKPEKKGKKKMAESKTTPKNVYQKLAIARERFLISDKKKSGKNIQLAFKYFELDDIVPIATAIFNEIGLISLVSMNGDTAVMQICNTDNPEERISFSAPFNQISPIVSNAGKQVTNEMQCLGSSITYMRRYLYMIALDICEPDEIDAGTLGATPSEPTTPAVTSAPTKKEETSLTDSNGNASKLQITQMKELLKKLREKDKSKEEWIAQIAVDTKGFTVITKADCEKLVGEINTLLNGGNE
jgi:hypothetical protein